jgi:hypothetical protein
VPDRRTRDTPLAYSLVPGEQVPGDACPHCWAPGLLASVEIALHGIHPATEDEQRLYEAIPVRHTVRTPFVKEVEMNKAVELELAPHQEGVDSRLVKDQEARSLLEQAAQASRELADDEKYRDELRAWTGHGVHVSPGYGVPADKLAPKPKDRRRPPVRDLGLTWDGLGEAQEYEKHRQLIKLTAKSDTPADWMRMGQALQRLLLTATRDEVERQLAGGELACPSCGGVLGGWGNGRLRPVRVMRGPDPEVVPRRSRCRQCGGTHVLLVRHEALLIRMEVEDRPSPRRRSGRVKLEAA